MNGQEFLLFLLPLINARSIRRRMSRIASYISPSAILSSAAAKHDSLVGNSAKIPKQKGRYWSLPQDQCAICAENASTNMNLSDPSNAFTSLSAPATDESSLHSETEPPAFPIYNPYLASCGDIYCYHCIAERLMQTADSGEDVVGWSCLRCITDVKSAERYTVELGSDGSGSDYEFSSDISGSASMGSYSECGWSDSSVS
ncbi:hypothetical protein H0H81_011152 [Sphagnurus paluster]|uniref:Uncharacterized protein n=1 Tax=Sphagnurus paluster TaxID=117069 RepID=A0A9P7KKN0_9AGAR|nr:hypothetical protein H0H81_011152 [Sphagnurus paluster]